MSQLKLLASILLAATCCAAQDKTICPAGIFKTLPATTNRTCNYLLIVADDKRQAVIDMHQDNLPNQGDWSYGVLNLSGKMMTGLKFHVLPWVDGNCPDGNGDAQHSANVTLTFDADDGDPCRYWYVLFPKGLWPGQSAWFSAEGDLGIVLVDPDLEPPETATGSVLSRWRHHLK
jgi:hypothetical protein